MGKASNPKRSSKSQRRRTSCLQWIVHDAEVLGGQEIFLIPWKWVALGAEGQEKSKPQEPKLVPSVTEQAAVALALVRSVAVLEGCSRIYRFDNLLN